MKRRFTNESTKSFSDSEKSSNERRRSKDTGMNKSAPAKSKNAQKDLCDCLNDDCPGCHHSCLKCSSEKCGPVCRVIRKRAFTVIEHGGIELITRNNNFKSESK